MYHILAILLPYKVVSYFKTFHWSRNVSVASSLKGVRIHCSAHCTLKLRTVSPGAEPFSSLLIDQLLVG